MFEKTNNTMGKDFYEFLACSLSLVTFGIYYGLYFATICGLAKAESRSVLILLQMMITGGLGFACYERNRNVPNLLLSVLLPFAIYISVAYLSVSAIVGLFAIYGLAWGVPPIVRYLCRDRITDLSYEQRVNLLKRIMYIEKKKLGIQGSLTLHVVPMSPGTVARYCFGGDRIEINQNMVKYDPKTMRLADAVAHECFHKKQADLLLSYNASNIAKLNDQQKRVIRRYRYEFQNYKTASKDGFKAYENQKTECHAREYAWKRWRTFYRRKMPQLLAQYKMHGDAMILKAKEMSLAKERVSVALCRSFRGRTM